ncbi:S-layer homology domain-containing protein [Lysinibacillus macroides]|uniref:SLH domain-containing protein n=1 Tax=Lysinibacillus macroides TaxID=33935 RepID=A0A0M9DMF6_9BACI|nr:S-layer homology domain-containing protein [Lysinibacillus macroides]KOY83416.1 hypothetical protein ADM90_09140 [Lysinibacillus macroides]QPR69285.1 S-layer homology domain-containing protein [Lysinibacillus macroides]
MKKKNLFLMATTAMLMTPALCVGFNPVTAEASTTFKDVKSSHWAYGDISKVAQKGYLKGYEDGTFRPSNQVTRSEFAAILSRILGVEATKKNSFSDVPSNHWAYDSINKGISAGFIEAGTGKFEPNKAMTRAEMATWLTKGLASKHSEYTTIVNTMAKSDLTLIPIPETYKGGVNKKDLPYIGVAIGTGLLNGYSDSTFKPNGNTTRAEVASIITRYLNVIEKKPTDFSELQELVEVAETGTNMVTVANIKVHEQSDGTFMDLRKEWYEQRSGIGKARVNRTILVDTTNPKNIKGVYRYMFTASSFNAQVMDKEPVYLAFNEHVFVASKSTPNALDYTMESNKPELLNSTVDPIPSYKSFGFPEGSIYSVNQWSDELNKQVNGWNIKPGDEVTMWFSSWVDKFNDADFYTISHLVNGKSYTFMSPL